MSAPIRPAVVFAVLAALAAPSAFAQQDYSYAQLAVGTGGASTASDSDRVQSVNFMVGWRFNNDFAIQAVAFGLPEPYRTVVLPDAGVVRDFNRFYGGQIVGYLNATSAWDIYGEVGAGRSTLSTQTPGLGSEKRTDALLGAGLRWQILDHIAASLDVSRLLQSQVTNTQLRGEFNF